MSDIHIGVVGIGKHGTRYANHLCAGDVRGAELRSVFRRNAELGSAYAKEHGVAYYDDYRALVDDEGLDAVVIVTPPGAHLPAAAAAAQQGKHVLIEKPMARTVEEAKSILDACQNAGVKLMVSQTMRYSAPVIEAKKRLASIGPIVAISACQRQEATTVTWQLVPDPSGGGNVLESGVHLFDMVRWVSGREVQSVFCRTDHLTGAKTEDAFYAILEMEGGIRCVVDGQKFTKSRVGKIEIVGENGQLIASWFANSLHEVHGREIKEIEGLPNNPTVPLVLRDFVAAIRGEKPLPITGEDGLRAVAVARACYASAEKGAVVPVRS